METRMTGGTNMSAHLLADSNPFEAVSRYLHHSERAEIGYVIAAGTALVLLGCGWALYDTIRTWFRDHATTLPALCGELARLHELNSAERALLVEASQLAPAIEPAFVFVDAARLSRLALARPDLADGCGRLANKLFDTSAA
jgi:hypothetical protein